jgi:hypothetical protein
MIGAGGSEGPSGGLVGLSGVSRWRAVRGRRTRRARASWPGVVAGSVAADGRLLWACPMSAEWPDTTVYAARRSAARNLGEPGPLVSWSPTRVRRGRGRRQVDPVGVAGGIERSRDHLSVRSGRGGRRASRELGRRSPRPRGWSGENCKASAQEAPMPSPRRGQVTRSTSRSSARDGGHSTAPATAVLPERPPMRTRERRPPRSAVGSSACWRTRALGPRIRRPSPAPSTSPRTCAAARAPPQVGA